MWFLATLAFGQDTVTCEATDSSGFSYAEWQKVGGAPGGNGTIVARVTWRRGEAVLHDKKRAAADFGRDPNAGVLQWTWDPATTQVESSTPPGVSQTTVYTTTARIWLPDGLTLASLPEREVEVPMRCTRVDVCCIP